LDLLGRNSSIIDMKFMIEMTWSKLMALVVVACAVYLDIVNGSGGQIFMFTLPFAVFLITGKQVIDWRKKRDENFNSA